jgi:hypothetical protein
MQAVVAALGKRQIDEDCHQAVPEQVGAFCGHRYPSHRHHVHGNDADAHSDLGNTRSLVQCLNDHRRDQ